VVIDEIVGTLCKNIKSADELDLKRAEQLIDEKLAPLLEGRVRDSVISST
jgi:hypothetical protein